MRACAAAVAAMAQPPASTGTLMASQPGIVSLPVASDAALRPDHTLPGRKPPWLRVKLPAGPGYTHMRGIVDDNKLHTVCE